MPRALAWVMPDGRGAGDPVLIISGTMGDSPWLPPFAPRAAAFTAMLMCSSPSDAWLPLGPIYSQVFVNCGYCALANADIWTLSTSHQPAISAISARLLVMIVLAWVIRGRITKKTAQMNRLECILFAL